jgi:hypothetical protein
VAPPGSYINVRDFPSPAALAERLHHLIRHPEEYLEYSRWRGHYRVTAEVDPARPHLLPASFPCSLCSYLAAGSTSQVTDLGQVPGPVVGSPRQVWGADSGCGAATYRCNRAREDWWPGRAQAREELRRRGMQRILQLQHMVG